MDLTQLRKAIYGICKALIPPQISNFLQNDTDRFVDGTIGSDTLYDGFAATIGSGHGPFKTIGRAMKDVYAVNLNGHNFNVHIANGTYNLDQRLDLLAPNGSGSIIITGNQVTPSGVTVNSLAGSCFAISGGQYFLRGMKIIANGSPIVGDVQAGVWCVQGITFLSNIEWGNCVGAHMAGGATWAPHDQHIITGNAPYHYLVTGGSVVIAQPSPAALNIPGAVSFSGAFIFVSSGGSFSGVAYASITGAANATGIRYNANTNGTIQTPNGSPTYFPGSLPGVTSSGGQYV
jgi:hypothetical protein